MSIENIKSEYAAFKTFILNSKIIEVDGDEIEFLGHSEVFVTDDPPGGVELAGEGIVPEDAFADIAAEYAAANVTTLLLNKLR